MGQSPKPFLKQKYVEKSRKIFKKNNKKVLQKKRMFDILFLKIIT